MKIIQAKKESATDALKRALRIFGNSLGNCLYNKNYLKKVSKVKKPLEKPIDPQSLYRLDCPQENIKLKPKITSEPDATTFDDSDSFELVAADLEALDASLINACLTQNQVNDSIPVKMETINSEQSKKSPPHISNRNYGAENPKIKNQGNVNIEKKIVYDNFTESKPGNPNNLNTLSNFNIDQNQKKIVYDNFISESKPGNQPNLNTSSNLGKSCEYMPYKASAIQSASASNTYQYQQKNTSFNNPPRADYQPQSTAGNASFNSVVGAKMSHSNLINKRQRNI